MPVNLADIGKLSIQDLLDQTLLFTASPKPRLVSASFPLERLTGGRPDVRKSESPSERKIWEFELNGVDGVRNVTIRHRQMRDMRMTVCESINWCDVKVNYKGRTLLLPLTNRFLLQTWYLPEGQIPESDTGYWQLPMNLDQSFQRLFGFQLTGGQIQPLGPGALEDRHLMAPPSPLVLARANNGSTQAAPPLRVLVCMTLGCAKERNDFEPGEVLGAARLMPHLMLVSNLPVDSMEATVTLAREPTTPHTRMEKEEMTSRISSAFFTDRNGNFHPYPAWDNLFDYYWIDPPVNTEVKVVRSDRPGIRKRSGLIKELKLGSSRGSSYIAGQEPRDIEKVPRQGEFDNIHMAPKMKLPASVVGKIPSGWPREVTMAPFCVHDCFHVHWRWGKGRVDKLNPKWVRGWEGDTPYRTAGAPMVAPNQDVTLKMLSPVCLAYTATIHEPVAGRWQIVMHHGAAYALTYTPTATIAQYGVDGLTADLPGEDGDEGAWALFYWHLRYQFVEHPMNEMGLGRLDDWLGAPGTIQDKYAERLSWDAGDFRKARDL